MANLPYGMSDEVEITLTLRGPAGAVLADVRRLREASVERIASITTLVTIQPGRGDREPYILPTVKEGDGGGALSAVDGLAKQSRIGPALELKLDAAIMELAKGLREEA